MTFRVTTDTSPNTVLINTYTISSKQVVIICYMNYKTWSSKIIFSLSVYTCRTSNCSWLPRFTSPASNSYINNRNLWRKKTKLMHNEWLINYHTLLILNWNRIFVIITRMWRNIFNVNDWSHGTEKEKLKRSKRKRNVSTCCSGEQLLRLFYPRQIQTNTSHTPRIVSSLWRTMEK